VNGLDGFKFAELLLFMAIEAVVCMVLICVRVPTARVPFLRREARAQLGPRAECLVSTPVLPEQGDPRLSIKVGGNAIVLNNRWGPQLVHYKSDPSRLSVVNEAILAFPVGRLQVLATLAFPTGEYHHRPNPA